MSDEFTHKMASEFLKNFNSKAALSKYANSMIDGFDGFDELKVVIPWYLKPFSGRIRFIARASFIEGRFSRNKDSSDTVKIRRPIQYRNKL